jgi:branched-subunit amino acid ABC-type transport system permease component
MTVVWQALGFGITSSTLLMFGAVGFSLQYGLTNLFNFAYGSIMTASAFVAYAAVQAGWGIAGAALVAATFGALFSTALNAFVYRPFARRGAGLFGLAFVAFSFGTVLQYVVALIFGVNYVGLNVPTGGTYHLGAMIFTGLELKFFAFAVASFLVLEMVLKFTRVGKAIRGTAGSPTLARACAIPVKLVVNVTWLISGAMCGLAGFYLATELGSFSFTSGAEIFPIILAAALVGRVGSVSGAFRGAVLVGVSTELLAALTNPGLKEVYAFTLLLLVIVFRRQGILRSVAEQAVVT